MLNKLQQSLALIPRPILFIRLNFSPAADVSTHRVYVRDLKSSNVK